MVRDWQLYLWTGKEYRKPISGGTTTANGPQAAIKRFGLDDPTNAVASSRRGYGYYTGRIEIRLPETVATGIRLNRTLPADFLLLAMN